MGGIQLQFQIMKLKKSIVKENIKIVKKTKKKKEEE